jgi:hypothetical protein
MHLDRWTPPRLRHVLHAHSIRPLTAEMWQPGSDCRIVACLTMLQASGRLGFRGSTLESRAWTERGELFGHTKMCSFDVDAGRNKTRQAQTGWLGQCFDCTQPPSNVRSSRLVSGTKRRGFWFWLYVRPSGPEIDTGKAWMRAKRGAYVLQAGTIRGNVWQMRADGYD